MLSLVSLSSKSLQLCFEILRKNSGLPTARAELEVQSAVTAGLSSFGFSGTNAHIVLGDAPAGSQVGQAELHMRCTRNSLLRQLIPNLIR